MITKDLYMRIRHAQNRRGDAFRRLRRREVLRMIGVDLSKQTEIQYVELGHNNSQVISKIEVAPAEEIEFLTPNSIFRHNFDSKFIVEMSNVLVNTETNHIYVSENSKNVYKLLKESSSWPTDLVLLNAEKPKWKSIKKVSVAALGLSNNGFYHWLSDDLPDFLLNKQNLPILNYKKTNVVNLQLIKLLGREFIQCDKWVFVEKLTFVTKGQDLGYLHPSGAKVLKDFNRKILDYQEANSEKIYISRSKSRRSISNEKAIEDYLLDRGFKIIYAEDFTFPAQVNALSGAKLVVGIHGAGLTHGLWSEKSTLIELMPNNRVNRCFEWQTLICGGTHQLLYFDPNLPAEVSVVPQLELLNL
jgi:hypothetical protein